MPEVSEKTTGPGNVVPHQGDHDRVAMLSVKVDGTPDQHNPEFVGDRETALAATRRQFREQAVSAVDVAERQAAAEPAEVVDDPSVAELRKKHDAAGDRAEKAAESVVEKLA